MCRAESIKQLFDIARSSVIGTLPANDRVAMVIVSRGVGVPMADDANRRGSADLANVDATGSVNNNPFLVRPDGVLVDRPPPHDRAQTPTVAVRVRRVPPAPVFGLQSDSRDPGRGRRNSPWSPSTTGPDNRAQALECRRKGVILVLAWITNRIQTGRQA